VIGSFKSHVGRVPGFVRRGGAVHVVIDGVEVSALPESIFLATYDAAGVVAAEIRQCRPRIVRLKNG
jgi:hypothetical protein